MNETERIVAILLAAGRSRRMGAFKPLLPFGPRTMIEACLENLHEAGVRKAVVVVGHRAAEVRAKLKDWPVSFAYNPDPSSAMSASIACGVAMIREADAVMVALADQPAIPASVVRALLDEWARSRAKLLVPEWQGRRGHPVLVDFSLREELLRLDEDRGLRALLDRRQEELRSIPVESPYVVRDVDTWEEYCALHEEVFGRAER